MASAKLKELSERQKTILMAIIKEFMSEGGDVGSTLLVDKYDLGVSSATIRSEMCRLMDMGFLHKSHISSGRRPTDQAIRLYIKDVIEDADLDALDSAEIRQELYRVRFSPEQLLRSILKTLSQRSRAASFITVDNDLRYHGVSNLMGYEELRRVKILQRVIELLEDDNFLRNLISKYENVDVSVLIGAETGIEDFGSLSLAFTKLPFWKDRNGYMGVVGSRRLDYSKVIPLMNTIKNSVESSLRGWN